MNIIVTGASKGIGREIVKQFSENGQNNIIAISRNKQLLEKLQSEVKNPEKLSIIASDLNEITSDDNALIKQIKNQFKDIDILINNAGALINKAFIDTSFEEAQSMFNTNFFASAGFIQKLIPLLKKDTVSHVVNIGSMAGFQGSSKFPGLTFYSASKAAISGLTECLAQEYIDSNIRFNCLALGAVQTEMLNQAFPGYKAPVSAKEMATFIVNFSSTGQEFFNGKIIPIALTNPS